MTGKKMYLQPYDMILTAIHDLAGLQKATVLLNDSPNGIIHLRVTMYKSEREYRFTVKDVVGNRSDVTIEFVGEDQDKQRLIDHEFALLDYVLVDRAKIELVKIEEWDKRIRARQSAKLESNENGLMRDQNE